jgi:regulation of enolase protein 1 (concanavalin A-like superfamily)
MTKLKLKSLVLALSAITAATTVHAGSITNIFDTAADFVANGVVGTMWDGVYLKAGDIAGGGNGGDGNGTTLVADANTTLPGYLYVQSTASSWAGAGDDGFFLYKNVSGDFDVSVQIAAFPYQSVPYHFAGLLARATAFPSGAPFGGSENWVNITRFQEFGLGEGVRYATNGADNEFVYTAGDDADTNTARYVRMTRAGDTFSFFNKTNLNDAWNLVTTLSRPDLAGQPMQVGLEQTVFTDNSPFAAFTDFQLTAPNVGNPTTPPANPANLTITPAPGSNNLTFSWTAGAGSAGSVLLIRANNSVIAHKPSDGFTYTGDTNFSSTANIFGGSDIHVVYVGPGNSVTVTGLGGSNNTYYASVFSYSGTGSSTVYGGTPATASAAGPGNLSAVSFTLAPTSIPVGGAAVAKVTATYSSGDSYDVSSAVGTEWVSSDSAKAIASNGTVSGVGIGTATISATYVGITGTNNVTVHAPAFTDNFSTSHDYLLNGLPGSSWDGIYMAPGDLPGANDGGNPILTTVANANISSNNVLSISAAGTEWEGDLNGGFFMFKKTAGDFQAVVHVTSISHQAYLFAGLMARAAEPDGAAFGGSEDRVSWWFFDQYTVITSARAATDGVEDYADQAGAPPANSMWLLLQRVNGTNFYCYQKANASDPWTLMPGATKVQPNMVSGVPVQVGLAHSTFTGSPSELVRFDSFMMDASDLVVTPPAAASGLTFSSPTASTLTLNWTPGAGSTGSVVVVRAAAPVNQQPVNGTIYSANPGFGLGSNLGSGNYVVYVGSGTSVLVTNLTPGAVYYAAVYSYGGPAGLPVYNQQTAASSSLTFGVLNSIAVSGPERVPSGGIGRVIVLGNYSGGLTTTLNNGLRLSVDNTNVLITSGANAFVTGLSNGVANLTVVYTNASGSFTNSRAVTVGAPTFTDSFNANHDYVANGVVGSAWDGVFTSASAPSGSVYVPEAGASISSADANISSNSTLSVTTVNVGWEGAQDNGFFLFKNVSGDFQTAIHIQNTLITVTESSTNVNAIYNNPGLLARAVSNSLPFVGGTNESWVSWTRFDEFGIGNYARRTLNNGTTQSPQPSVNDGDYWLLLVRENGTNFSFYQRSTNTEPWRPAPNGTTYSIADFQGVPMQVGLLAGNFNSGVTAVSQFDSFLLDVVVPKPTLQVSKSGNNIVISWPAGPGVLQLTPTLNPANWVTNGLPVPVTVNGTSSVTLPITNAASFFRLAQ